MMKSNIGLHIGFNFAEVFIPANLSKNSQDQFLLWYTGKKNLQYYLKELFNSNEDLRSATFCISSDWSKKCLKYKQGADLAFLTTSGFEKWPYLRQPDLRQYFTADIQRAEPILSPDFIFGLSERSTANGEIDKKIDSKELDFIYEKLKLLSCKNISLGFLHSEKNPQNEIIAKKYFEEKGISTHISSTFNKASNEVSRWWACVVQAYCSDYYEIESKSLVEKAEISNFRFFPKAKNSKTADTNFCSSSLFSSIELLAKVAEQKNASLLYLGYEDFYIIDGKERSAEWQSGFGPVAIEHAKHWRSKVQPTSLIHFNKWAAGELSNEELSFDPGPVILGRSTKLQLIDILWFCNKLSANELQSDIHSKAKERVNEALNTYSKESSEKLNTTEFADAIFDNSVRKLAKDCYEAKPKNNKLIITGPLALTYYSSLKKILSPMQIELDTDHMCPIAKAVSQFGMEN